MKLKKGKHEVVIDCDDDSLPVEYYNYIKAGWVRVPESEINKENEGME